MKVLDTNVIIYLLNHQLVTPLPVDQYLVSVISRIELLGWKDLSLGQEATIQAVLADLTIVGIDDPLIDLVIELRKTTNLRIPDAMIAATAMLTDSELVTRDVGFKQVPGLKVIPIEIVANP